MIVGIVFDMDGILVDTEKYWQQARIAFAESIGKPWTVDDQRNLMGSSTLEWAAYMKRQLEIETSLDDIIHEIKGRLLPYYEANLPIMPGAVAAVQLTAQHYPIALASGSAPWAIDAIMRITGLGPYFKVQVSADEVGRGKPAPDVFLEAARRLGIPPTQMLGIEDSGNGIRSLKAANMKAIAVPTPELPLAPEVEAMADVVLTSLESFDLPLIHRLDQSSP